MRVAEENDVVAMTTAEVSHNLRSRSRSRDHWHGRGGERRRDKGDGGRRRDEGDGERGRERRRDDGKRRDHDRDRDRDDCPHSRADNDGGERWPYRHSHRNGERAAVNSSSTNV